MPAVGHHPEEASTGADPACLFLLAALAGAVLSPGGAGPVGGGDPYAMGPEDKKRYLVHFGPHDVNGKRRPSETRREGGREGGEGLEEHVMMRHAGKQQQEEEEVEDAAVADGRGRGVCGWVCVCVMGRRWVRGGLGGRGALQQVRTAAA